MACYGANSATKGRRNRQIPENRTKAFRARRHGPVNAGVLCIDGHRGILLEFDLQILFLCHLIKKSVSDNQCCLGARETAPDPAARPCCVWGFPSLFAG